MPRLRRTSTAQPGWTRRRAGRGFVYLDAEGKRLAPDAVARIRTMAIPPAWRDVWISPWPHGHLQAVGTDAAGRRQYLYHEHWRRIRDRQKYDRALELAQRLPAARTRVAEDLAASGMPRGRALATAFRLLDLGALRIGGERYAEAHSSYGLATLRRDHAGLVPGGVRLRFTGKGGRDHEIVVADPAVRASVRVLLRRDDESDRLLAWEEDGRWHDVGSADINDYIHEVTGTEVSAKDFRTWHGTALAAAALASWAAGNGTAALPTGRGRSRSAPARAGGRGTTRVRSGGAAGRGGAGGRGPRAAAARRAAAAARRRAVAAAVRDVADHLGNTPTVARTSYIDPRVVERFLDGTPLPPLPPLLGTAAGADARATAAPVTSLGRGPMEDFEVALLGWLSSS